MSAKELLHSCAPATSTMREALEAIDRGAAAVCLLLHDDGRLAGLITDGDARRALLQGVSLEEPALEHATRSPHVVAARSGRAHVLDLMRALHVGAVPEVDSDGIVVGLHTLLGMVGPEPLPNVAVIMAGGRGTRLGELTRERPKPLMTVAGRTILEWIVLSLVGDGIREVYVSVNYLSEQIEQHLGDGIHLGCSINYLREDPDTPLGTAGCLAILLRERPSLRHPVVVMNGDLMVQFDAAAMLDAHRRSGSSVTVSTRAYEHQIPFGVVAGDETTVSSIEEKPIVAVSVNAGIYALSPEVLELVPRGHPCTMPDLVQSCLDHQLPVGRWTLATDWIDIGTPTDLARAKGHM